MISRAATWFTRGVHALSDVHLPTQRTKVVSALYITRLQLHKHQRVDPAMVIGSK